MKVRIEVEVLENGFTVCVPDIEAMNKADELGLVTAEEPFTRSRMKFTANYEALKQFMS